MSNGANRILDDLARLMTDAAGAAQGVRREVESAFRAQAERILGSMDIVQREEFEAVREMALRRVARTCCRRGVIRWRSGSPVWIPCSETPGRLPEQLGRTFSLGFHC